MRISAFMEYRWARRSRARNLGSNEDILCGSLPANQTTTQSTACQVSSADAQE
jgi:hypothetical protein